MEIGSEEMSEEGKKNREHFTPEALLGMNLVKGVNTAQAQRTRLEGC